MSAEMLARAINYGRSRAFPTCLGNIFLPHNTPIDIPDARAARELQAHPLVHVMVVEGELDSEKEIDYSGYPIWELRSIAARRGIARSFFLTKEELIKKLEESHGISSRKH